MPEWQLGLLLILDCFDKHHTACIMTITYTAEVAN